MTPPLEADALVIGGGLAGAALAARLAAQGRDTLVLERNRAPADKVCGEFLRPEAVAELDALGLHPSALGAVPLDSLTVHHNGARLEAPLPETGYGIPRRMLDEALLGRAESQGARVRRGETVTRAERGADGWEIVTRSGMGVRAPRIYLATGKQELRGHARAAASDDVIGFRLAYRVPSVGNRPEPLHLVWFDGGYAGLMPNGPGTANLCLTIERARFRALGGRWSEVDGYLRKLAPGLDEALRNAEPLSAAPTAVYRTPYGFLFRPRPSDPPGLHRLGDQAAVIPSFTGCGMALALVSARILAEEAASDSRLAQARLADTLRPAMRRAAMLERLARTRAGRATMMHLATLAEGLLPGLFRVTRPIA